MFKEFMRCEFCLVTKIDLLHSIEKSLIFLFFSFHNKSCFCNTLYINHCINPWLSITNIILNSKGHSYLPNYLNFTWRNNNLETLVLCRWYYARHVCMWKIILLFSHPKYHSMAKMWSLIAMCTRTTTE